MCREVPRERVKDVILGYTCANDVTARDVQKREKQWARAKGFDTSCPLGPWVETDLDPPRDLTIQLTVNGEQRQLGRTSEMIHSIEDLIVNITEAMTLLPGDVILTGTPAGVGPLTVGDEVAVTIEGIGTLTNKVDQAWLAHPASRRPRPFLSLARPATPTWAWSAPPCSTGRSPGTTGGTLVFRIEDTDAARDSEESYDQLLDSLRWLGFDWDEGPEVGGPHAPYRQSQRMDIYEDVAAQAPGRRPRLPLLLLHRGAGRPPRRRPRRRQALRLRRPLPRPDRRAGRGVPGRGPHARSSASGCPTRRSPSRTWSAAS